MPTIQHPSVANSFCSSHGNLRLLPRLNVIGFYAAITILVTSSVAYGAGQRCLDLNDPDRPDENLRQEVDQYWESAIDHHNHHEEGYCDDMQAAMNAQRALINQYKKCEWTASVISSERHLLAIKRMADGFKCDYEIDGDD